MRDASISGLLVSHIPNIRYLCGFTGSAGVLALTHESSRFFTDGRYLHQAAEEVRADRVEVNGTPLAEAARFLAREKGKVGLDYVHLSVRDFDLVRKASKRRDRLTDASGHVEALRMAKDGAEIERIRSAVRLGSAIFDQVLKNVSHSVAENEIAAAIEYQARKRGAEGMSFETIVASGARSALPHGRASQQRLPRRGFLVLDFGVILSGYCSDMTRTVHLGKPSSGERRLYSAVKEAQAAAVAAVKPGKTAAQVDTAARSVLQKAGFGKFFSHSTGHGVGLEIHEQPRIAQKGREKLLPGMVITIEPGAYIPGKGGVRIEDMVVVTDDGCEVLTPTTKELIVV